MEELSSCIWTKPAVVSSPMAVMKTPTLSWQECARRDLTSGDMRLRLQSYSTLSLKCSESKDAQKQVGQLLGSNHHNVVFPIDSLLNVIFEDLQSTDRTLRVAAARVLCLVTYENLANQQMIMKSQVVRDDECSGVTVGWVHVFFIPQLLRDEYESECEEQGELATTDGLNDFVSTLIKDNYALVYSRISRYYARGCREFLPLCWFHALVRGSSSATELMHIPDPSDNLLGFYLVPRQTQFPEQDEIFLQEMLSSIQSEEELSRLQQVHFAFQQVAGWAPTNEVRAGYLISPLEGIYEQHSVNGKGVVMPPRDNDILHWLEASPERMISWNEMLVYCCSDLHADEMIKRHGANTYWTVNSIFRRLSLDGGLARQEELTNSYVWESVLIETSQRHPDLPDELKATIKDLSGGIHNRFKFSRSGHSASKQRNKTLTSSIDEIFERPWEHLLSSELTDIHPISWSVFLGKWRKSADKKHDGLADLREFNTSGRRHHSLCDSVDLSLLAARKNAFVTTIPNHRIFHSFRDLNQLRKQLPLIVNATNEEPVQLSPTTDRPCSSGRRELSEEEKRELTERRRHFQSLRQSPTNLDNLTRKRLEDKQAARSKAHQDAAENRKKSNILAEQRRNKLERVQRDKLAKVQALAKRKENQWRNFVDVREERHQRAQRWRQAQYEADIARQDKFIQQQQHQRCRDDFNRSPVTRDLDAARVSAASPRTPISPASERQTPIPRRPLSARARTSTDPKIVRERAQVYGCAASKAFTARRPQTARPNLSSTADTRRSSRASRQSDGSGSLGETGRCTSNDSTADSTDSSAVSLEAGSFENACKTLVMANAALAVAEHITIPPVATPVSEEESVPPALIMAQYSALEDQQRLKLYERYCGNRISHKLTFAVLQQLTHEMRQDAAWREFLKATGSSNSVKKNKNKREAKVTHAAFVNVAAQLGVSMPPKKLQAVARSLDPWKTGFVGWEAFYAWWSSQ